MSPPSHLCLPASACNPTIREQLEVWPKAGHPLPWTIMLWGEGTTEMPNRRWWGKSRTAWVGLPGQMLRQDSRTG